MESITSKMGASLITGAGQVKRKNPQGLLLLFRRKKNHPLIRLDSLRNRDLLALHFDFREKSKARISLSVCLGLLLSPLLGHAQEKATEDLYADSLKSATTIRNGGGMFGDRVSPQTGAVSFSQVDFSFPGNGPEISISRQFTVDGSDTYEGVKGRAFADWSLEIPRITTITATATPGGFGSWSVGGSQPLARCSQYQKPPPVAIGPNSNFTYPVETWWLGVQLLVPAAITKPHGRLRLSSITSSRLQAVPPDKVH